MIVLIAAAQLQILSVAVWDAAKFRMAVDFEFQGCAGQGVERRIWMVLGL